MSNSHLPVDIYSNFNALVKNVTEGGDHNFSTEKVVTIGQAAQIYGYENTLNKLSVAMGNTLIAVRPYRSRFGLIEQSPEEWGQFARKISYYSGEFEKSQDYQVSGATNLADGQAVDHYAIKKRYPLEVWFGGMKVLQKHYTRFRKQLKVSFSNAEDFARFYEGEVMQINNEIQMLKELENRAVVLNMAAACIRGVNTTVVSRKFPAGMARNMTAEYNAKYGTTYTTKELLTVHLKEFTGFFAGVLKYQSDLLAQATTLYHVIPKNVKGDGDATLTLWRHTPKEDQRLMLNSSVLYDMETTVYPEIFHDGYLRLDQYEAVPFWSDVTDPLNLSVKAINTLNPTTGLSDTLSTPDAGEKTVLGIMFDKWACGTHYRQEDVVTTPVNAAGDYYNTYYHWAKDYRNDLTENIVVFYMSDTAA